MPVYRRAPVKAAQPKAEEAVAVLREAGREDLARAVSTVLAYAMSVVGEKERKAAHDAGLEPNRALPVDPQFRENVRRMAAERGVEVSAVVRKGLDDFLAGRLRPAEPVRGPNGSLRYPGKTGPPSRKVAMNVRVGDDLWERVEALGLDEDAVEARGYPLRARHVAVAALVRRFPKAVKYEVPGGE